MTKIEYEKCEKLMEEAIQKVKQAQEEYEESESLRRIGYHIKSEVEQRKADQHYGCAEGINQALVMLGFKHDRMKKLSELL